MNKIVQVLCANCEDIDSPVVVQCLTCQPKSYYCESCDIGLHAPRNKQHHERKPYAPTVHGGLTNNEGVPIWCICRQPDDGKRMMIGCSSCPEWFHLDCIGLAAVEAEMMYAYICDSCKIKKQVRDILNYGKVPTDLLTEVHIDTPLWDNIPAETKYNVLEYLDGQSLCRSFQVCRRWMVVNDHQLVWKLLVYNKWKAPLREAKRMKLSVADPDNVDWKLMHRYLDDGAKAIVNEHFLNQLAVENALLKERVRQSQALQAKLDASTRSDEF